jgi:O-methyltransferase/methyltransferase family protein
MSDYDLPPTDDRAIWDTWLSMHHLPSVTVADELGIFSSLEAAHAGAVELADRLGYDRRTTVAVVRMLAALGYLQHRLGVYQLTDTARLYLLKDSPYYWGYMLGNRINLHETLKGRLQGKSPAGIPGQRPEDPKTEGSAGSWASGNVDMERARRVAAAMHSHSLPAAIGLARNADFSGVSRLLDVGAGSGCYPIALARANPGLRATIMELPAMCEVAQEYVDAGGVADRIDTIAVDMFREPWPDGYDAVFFANVWHDWNFETCAWLAGRTYDALPSGGRVFLHEMLLDDDGDGPVTTVSFSMLMLGTEGQQFTLPELKVLLEGAGFTGVQARHTYGYYSLVSARKV